MGDQKETAGQFPNCHCVPQQPANGAVVPSKPTVVRRDGGVAGHLLSIGGRHGCGHLAGSHGLQARTSARAVLFVARCAHTATIVPAVILRPQRLKHRCGCEAAAGPCETCPMACHSVAMRRDPHQPTTQADQTHALQQSSPGQSGRLHSSGCEW